MYRHGSFGNQVMHAREWLNVRKSLMNTNVRYKTSVSVHGSRDSENESIHIFASKICNFRIIKSEKVA